MPHLAGPPGRDQEDADLAAEIQAVHEESKSRYGAPRVHAELRRRGHRHGRKRIARLMRQAGITARPAKRWKKTEGLRVGDHRAVAVVFPAGSGSDHKSPYPGPGVRGRPGPGSLGGLIERYPCIDRPIRVGRTFTRCSRGDRMSW
jgi:transposase InsO family protein